MSILLKVLLALQVICALVMIILILMQQGKGATAGATFGSGASGSLFGASGSATFLSRTTAVLATVFFASTLVLAYYGNTAGSSGSSVLSHLPAATQTAPASGSKAATTPTAKQAPAKAEDKKAPSAADQIPTETAPVQPDATPTPTAKIGAAAIPVAPAEAEKKAN